MAHRAGFAALAGLVPVAAAGAQIFNFDSLVHGEIITNQFEPALSITALNPNRSFDIAAAFDTAFMGPTNDPDLQGPPWSGGNLAISNTETQLGRAIIIAENNIGAGDGILDFPDDEARRPAGWLDLVFATPIPMFGFDFIDIQGAIEETTRLDFYSGGGVVGTLQLTNLNNPASVVYDPTIVFGNNTANRVQPVLASRFNVAGFDRVVINVGGSSAYDNFVVPAPASVATLAFAGLATTRRRR